jgi:hypothetical protein
MQHNYKPFKKYWNQLQPLCYVLHVLLFHLQTTINLKQYIMKKLIYLLTLSLFVCMSCSKEEVTSPLEQETTLKEIPEIEPLFVDLEFPTWSFASSNNGQDMSKSISGKSENREVVLYMAEYITSGDNNEAGNIIYFNNRGNKQDRADFVADSQYLNIPPEFGIYSDKTNDISYYVDDGRPSNSLDVGISTQAIERSMTTWDGITCSELGIFKRPYNPGIRTGVVAGNAHPIFDWSADVVHAGWMPLGFFDWFSGGRGANILGVTFTFVVAIDGVFSDDDNDGQNDVWFREIYYNDEFSWADGDHIDIETVSLHETGHGLSQGHFGKAFSNKGGVHFAPRAVMNASYSGVQTSVGKTDEAGHCSNWGNWPNK